MQYKQMKFWDALKEMYKNGKIIRSFQDTMEGRPPILVEHRMGRNGVMETRTLVFHDGSKEEDIQKETWHESRILKDDFETEWEIEE